MTNVALFNIHSTSSFRPNIKIVSEDIKLWILIDKKNVKKKIAKMFTKIMI